MHHPKTEDSRQNNGNHQRVHSGRTVNGPCNDTIDHSDEFPLTLYSGNDAFVESAPADSSDVSETRYNRFTNFDSKQAACNDYGIYCQVIRLRIDHPVVLFLNLYGMQRDNLFNFPVRTQLPTFRNGEEG